MCHRLSVAVNLIKLPERLGGRFIELRTKKFTAASIEAFFANRESSLTPENVMREVQASKFGEGAFLEPSDIEPLPDCTVLIIH